MKISLNWIKQFTDVDMPVDELVAKIGSQLGEVEGVENIGAKYDGVLVAKVVSCKDHPNADRLHVCMIDDGGKAEVAERDENGHVQVVCGAPNVREGITVAWLPPGSTVPDSVGKDPFVLEARELRGVVSNGMLASPKELAIGDSHDGILEIDKEAAPGSSFAELYKMDDYVIEIENKMFTHRPDCFGALGVAREIAGISGKQFSSPDWYKTVPGFPTGAGLTLDVSNEAPELVPRFMALAIKGVTIKPSPVWLQCALARLGQKSINNVVDATNFVMLLTAQPTHAYDYDKLRGQQLLARTAKPGETVTLLNHKTYELDPADIVIADGEGAVGLAGVMGGGDSEVSDTTTNIVLECATFDMYAVRRSAMRHGVFTDALTRFNKGQSPLQNGYVLGYLLDMITKLAGGEVAGPVCDLNQAKGRQWLHPPVPVTTEFINARLGLELSAEDMKTLLENVEFAVATDADKLTVAAPFWRTDIETREDVVEEIGRLYGFDKLPLQLPSRSIKPAPKNELIELKQHLRETLAKAGANEVLSYSFVHGNLLEKVGQDPAHAFKLSNALSPDLQYYRLSLLPSLLTNVHANSKAGYDQFALFEIGKAHVADQLDENGLPREDELTALVIAAADKLKQPGAAYYAAKRYLTELLSADLTFRPVPEDMQSFDITKPFAINRTAFVYAGDRFLGIIGEFRSAVKKALKLPAYCAGFELDTAALLEVVGQPGYLPLRKFPTVWQDLTLKVASDQPFADVKELVDTELGTNAPDDSHITLESLGIYQSKDDTAHKNISFRISVTGQNRTLTDKVVGQTVAAIAAAANKQLGAEQI